MSSLLHELASEPAAKLSAAMGAWQSAPMEAPTAADLVDGVRSCLELPGLLSKVSGEAFARESAFEDLTRLRNDLKTKYLCAKAIIRSVQSWAEELAELGLTIPQADQLPATLRRIEEMEDALFRHWTIPTEDDLKEAQEAHARGETLDIADAFAQIKGMTRDEWLRFVEDHKRSRGA